MSNWYQKHAFSRLPLTSDETLPALSVIALDHLALITAVGPETLHYLQGQLTCDLISLDQQTSTLAAHCDAKGKVWSILRLFHHQDGIGYTLPVSVMETQMAEIKKYAIFSKVIFSQSEQVLIGIAGDKADRAINLRFRGQTQVRSTQTGTAVQIEQNRWLLAVDAAEADEIIDSLGSKTILADHHLWDLYEIQAGIPSITANTCNQFIPQAINLQLLDGISFKKGCYTGQETIARAKYRGINKRATYILQGECVDAPQAGDSFDRQVGESWRTGGTVLAGFKFDDNQGLALVVLPNNLEENSQFRQVDQTPTWHKIAMPYAFEDTI